MKKTSSHSYSLHHILPLLILLTTTTSANATGAIDVTDIYITNADMTSTDGWNQNFTDTSTPGAFEFYAGWASLSFTTGNCSQYITLPSGTYSLTGYAFFRYGFSYSDEPSLSTGYLFANNQYKTTATLASATYTTYPNNIAEAYEAFYTDRNYLNELTFTLDTTATIEIGYKVNFTTAYSWFIVGAMNLYYVYENTYNALRSFTSSLQTLTLPAAMSQTVTQFLNHANTLTDTDDEQTLQAALDTAITLYATYTDAAQTYTQALQYVDSLATYADNAQETVDGAINTFKQAVDNTLTNIESAYTTTQIQNALDTLQTALKTFVHQAYPTQGTTFDLTFLITNNSFETGDLTGWSADSGSDTGAKPNSNATYTTTGTDGSYLFNTWYWESMDFTLSQKITDLPRGRYTLTALLASDAGNTITLVGGTQTHDATITQTDVFQKTQIDNIITGGTLTIGANSTTWFKADNFRLYLTGNFNDAINELTDTATAIDTTQLNTAIIDTLTHTVQYINTLLGQTTQTTTPTTATSYTDTYTVTLDDGYNAGTNTGTVYLQTDSTGAYQFTVSDLTVRVSGMDATVSNITLTNLNSTTNGLITTFPEQTQTVTAKLTISGLSLNLSVPATLSGEMTYRNLYATIYIDLTSMKALLSLVSSSINIQGATVVFGQDLYTTAVNTLQQTIQMAQNFAQTAATDYFATLNLINTCQTIATHSTPDTQDILQTFNTAIQTAQTNIEKALNQDDVLNVEQELEAQRQEYVLSAVPQQTTQDQTNPYAFDLTFLLPSSTQASHDAWTLTGTGTLTTDTTQNQTTTAAGLTPPYTLYTHEADTDTTAVTQITYTLTDLKQGTYLFTADILTTTTDTLTTTTDIQLTANTQTTQAYGQNTTVTTDNTTIDYGTYNVTATVSTLGTLQVGLNIQTNNITTLAIDNTTLLYLTDQVSETGMYQLLQQQITQAQTIVDQAINVGQNIFQIPLAAQKELTDSITKAQTYTQENTSQTLQTAIDNLQTALNRYQTVQLNNPTADQRVTITLNGDFTYGGNTLTYRYSATANGDYAMNWQHTVDPVYAQALTFTPTDSTNQYTISFVDSVGQTHYLCTNYTGYSTGNMYQIRTTTNPTLAMPVRVDISYDTTDLWTLTNTEALQTIGSNGNAEVYTSPRYTDITLAQAQTAQTQIQIPQAGWTTLILPFNTTLHENLTAMAVTTTDGTTDDGYQLLTTDTLATITANTPCILTGPAGTYEFADYGLAAADTYTTGLLCGTYTTLQTPQGTYLPTDDADTPAFERTTETTAIQPYTAYIPADDEKTQLLILPINNTDQNTAVQTLTAPYDNPTVNVYTTTGLLLRTNVPTEEALKNLPSGIYIVGGQKKAVR